MAKSALNQQTVTLALDLKEAGHGITVMALSPGFIPTRLSKFKGHIDMDESVQGMVSIIEKATMEDNGKFVRWNGEQMEY